MKKILLFGLLFVFLVAPVYAGQWIRSGDGSVCVRGQGDFKVIGQGDLYARGAGVLRFDRNVAPFVEIVGGDWSVRDTRRYTYYSGSGAIRVNDFNGKIASYGGGDGYLRLIGSGKVKLMGNKDSLHVGCR